MTERTCAWKYCRTKIEVDTSIEDRCSMFVVSGWCKVHQKAYQIYHDLEKKFCKKARINWPPGSKAYRENKEAFDQLHDLAGHRAKEEAKHVS